MAKLDKMPNKDIIDGLKGTVDFYLWMGIPVARSWPRSPGPERAPSVKQQWPAFSFAGSYWDSLDSNIKEAWNNMAKGTPVTGRDLFTRSFITDTHISF